MAKCYRCDMCGVVTILAEYGKACDFEVTEPDMGIYFHSRVYDICPNCAKKIVKFIERNGKTE